MLFGDAGTCLLEDLKSSTARPYRHAEVRAVLAEGQHLDTKMDEIRQQAGTGMSEELSVNYVLMKYFKERNERILRSYRFHRSVMLFDEFFSREGVAGMLSQDEEDYADRLHALLDKYLEPFSILDFTVSTPPIQFFVQVVTLEDCGVVMDEGDLIELKKNRVYFIKKSTIAHLINNGFVRVI